MFAHWQLRWCGAERSVAGGGGGGGAGWGGAARASSDSWTADSISRRVVEAAAASVSRVGQPGRPCLRRLLRPPLQPRQGDVAWGHCIGQRRSGVQLSEPPGAAVCAALTGRGFEGVSVHVWRRWRRCWGEGWAHMQARGVGAEEAPYVTAGRMRMHVECDGSPWTRDWRARARGPRRRCGRSGRVAPLCACLTCVVGACRIPGGAL